MASTKHGYLSRATRLNPPAATSVVAGFFCIFELCASQTFQMIDHPRRRKRRGKTSGTAYTFGAYQQNDER